MVARTAEILSDRRVDWLPLRTFIVLRWIAVAGQLSALLVARTLFGMDVPLGLAVPIVGVAAMANVVATFIYPENKRLTECEAARHLVFDLAQLTALLAVSGGLTNPFALLILVPVTVSATALKKRTTTLVGAGAIAGVSLLALVHRPLGTASGILELPQDFLIGFWAAIAIGIAFIAAYVQRVTSELAAMSDALAATQMALAREQKLTDLGGMVAAAAHELGTPLATIKLAGSELLEDLADRPEAADDLRLIVSQADRCRDILRAMGRAGLDDPHLSRLPVAALVREAAEPHVDRGKNLNWDIAARDGIGPDQPVVDRRPEVVHGLRNLVQNAVDFARENVWIDIRWDASTILVRIVDDGPGFVPDLLGRIGDPFVRSDASPLRKRPQREGLGLGLFIAKTLLERSGAELSFANGRDRTAQAASPPGHRSGAIVEVTWPLAALTSTGVVSATAEPGDETFPVAYDLKQ